MSMGTRNYAYLGKAVSYPLKLRGGSPLVIGGNSVIEASLTMLLTTPTGTREVLPDWGCRINELLWETNDLILERLLITYITDAVVKWEKRVHLVGVEVATKGDISLCRILYKVLPSNEIDAYVFPFSKRGLPY